MQCYRRQIQAQQCHILHYQGIHSGVVKFPHKLAGSLQLIVVYYCVDGHIHLGIEAVGVLAHTPYTFHTIACCRAGAESLGADIHRIGTVSDGLYGSVGVAGRRQ